MPPQPFLLHKNAQGQPLRRIGPQNAAYNEFWLQELIRRHPEILPTGEFETVFSPLVPIGREVLTISGPIDNLFISRHGYPVLVETRLWRNPEARRELLAQAIDYASAIANWRFSNLDEVIRKYTKKVITYPPSSLPAMPGVERVPSFKHATPLVR
jgi:hypothetical protein